MVPLVCPSMRWGLRTSYGPVAARGAKKMRARFLFLFFPNFSFGNFWVLFCLSVFPGGTRLTVHRRLLHLRLGWGGVPGPARRFVIGGLLFQILSSFLPFNFALTIFTLVSGSNYNGWYPWFVGLWVLGGGKSGGPVTKICEKNVKNFEKIFFFKNSFFKEINRF